MLAAAHQPQAQSSNQPSSAQQQHNIYIEQQQQETDELFEICEGERAGGECPENISSEEEEPELGLGELLEEHRAHFFMEKLSGNFSTNDLQQDGGSQALDSCNATAPNDQNKLKQAKSQSTSQDMLMQSCSGDRSVNAHHNGDANKGACSLTSIVMKSSDGEGGYSQYDGGDRKMKSLEEVPAAGGPLDSERDGDESSTSYPQIQADAQNDFQKAS